MRCVGVKVTVIVWVTIWVGVEKVRVIIWVGVKKVVVNIFFFKGRSF